VGGDDFLVPVEAVLAQTAVVAGAVVVLVDVDEAVALGHLAGGGGHQVDAAPGGVAHQVHAVLDSLGHLLDVAAQVVDAVAVVDGAVGLQGVVGTQTVLHHHQGDAVAVIDLVQGVAQALGIDLPAPVAGLQVGVLESAHNVAVDVVGVLVGGDAVGHVVAEGVEVHRALFQDFGVARLHPDGDALVGPHPLGVAGIFAPHLDVGTIPVGLAHGLLVGQNVGGVAGVGIGGDEAVHVAHLELGVVLVGVVHRQGAGNKLVVQRLEPLL